MFYTRIEAKVGAGDNFKVVIDEQDETHPYALLFAHVEGGQATHQVRIRLSAQQVRVLIEKLMEAEDLLEATNAPF